MAQYQCKNKLKDKNFNIDDLHFYSLIIQVGVHDLQIVVVDTQTGKCMGLEDYLLMGIETANDRLYLLKRVFDGHEYLRAGFWKDIRLSVKGHKFSLVPKSCFDSKFAGYHLVLNGGIKPNFERVGYYDQSKTGAINVFTVEKKLGAWIQSMYRNKKVKIIHEGSAFIEGIIHSKEFRNGKGTRCMYCLVDREKLHLMVTGSTGLLYYNQFVATKKEDFLKYIMALFKEMGMNIKKHRLIFWGFASPKSPIISYLSKYFKYISFGSKPAFLRFSYLFDEIPDQCYFGVLSSYLCK